MCYTRLTKPPLLVHNVPLNPCDISYRLISVRWRKSLLLLSGMSNSLHHV